MDVPGNESQVGTAPVPGGRDWVSSMDVYWLEQNQADVPAENDWLSTKEVVFQDSLRFAKRRADWRLGRWTAKRTVAVCLRLPCSPLALARLEICPAPTGAPEVFLENKRAGLTISISHRSDRAICAVGPAAVELGCDLERIEPHSDAFLADYFTAQEQALVARQPGPERLRLLALLWSGKESALKALHAGLALDTRSVIVDLVSPTVGDRGWSPFRVRFTGGRIFDGWWQAADPMVRTLVAAPPPAPPIALAKLSAMVSHA
jgi:4'-phosphopantetheinyl transferase